MPIVRIEHPVPDFDIWKLAFDRDPASMHGGTLTRQALPSYIDALQRSTRVGSLLRVLPGLLNPIYKVVRKAEAKKRRTG